MILSYGIENIDRVAYLLFQHIGLFGFSLGLAVITGLVLGSIVASPALERYSSSVLSFFGSYAGDTSRGRNRSCISVCRYRSGAGNPGSLSL